MSVTLTFKRAEVEKIIRELEAATAYNPTYDQLFDARYRKDGRDLDVEALGPDEWPEQDDIDPTKLEPGLWLVADHGVYLMGNHQRPEGTKATVTYAKGGNPEKNGFDTWYDLKDRIFGGSDGVEYLPLDFVAPFVEKMRTAKYGQLKVQLLAKGIALKAAK